ncbi:MAG TPA: glycosyltransferase family 2 protein [Methylocella sp.]|nr:glycosyltransferase family 2 protein [Methylocella sp.]
MKLFVIIPTFKRRDLLDRVLEHLDGQTRPPDEVIISAPDDTHVGTFRPKHFEISYVFGKQGLCAQRNQAIERALGRCDIITFFDDDFLPADDYLRRLEQAFWDNPAWAVIMGHAVADGARNAGYTFNEGLTLLRQAERQERPLSVSDHVGAYGCNMSMRASQIGDLRCDERLVLYGWQEDIDFTSQLRRFGRIVGLSTLMGVHLGSKSGRESGIRLGYSQVANPVYLMRKGTVPASFALEIMGRNVVANMIKSLWPEPYADRRGRLKGNLLAAGHLFLGRIDPEYILKL